MISLQDFLARLQIIPAYLWIEQQSLQSFVAAEYLSPEIRKGLKTYNDELQSFVAEELAYWRTHLYAAPTSFPLPLARSHREKTPVNIRAIYEMERFSFVGEAMQRFCEREQITLFTLLLALWKTLLYRYTNLSDLVVGTTSRSLRPEPATWQSNLVALRTTLSDSLSLREVIALIAAETTAVKGHLCIPFDVLVQELGGKSDGNTDRLFNTMCVLQRLPDLAAQEQGDWRFQGDLSLIFRETEQGWQGTLEYNSEVLPSYAVKRIADHFQALLEQCLANPDQSIVMVSLLTTEEQAVLKPAAELIAEVKSQTSLATKVEAVGTKTLDHITDVNVLLDHPDPFRIPYKSLQALQLRFLQSRFAENRNRIPALQRAADRKGIQAIGQLRDVVALLFSHTTYKSYPETFLDKGQWDKMNQWVATLSTRGEELRQIDVSQVTNLDDWLALLDKHDFALCHSSGTGGKPSFLPKSVYEQVMMGLAYCAVFKLGQGIDPHVDKMPVFCITFQSGWSTIIRRNHELARAYTLSPTTIEYAFNQTQSPSTLRYELKTQKLISEGRVAPDEFDAFQKFSKEKQATSALAFQNFVQRTLTYKGQRVMILGHTATVFQLAVKGREMGVENVFAPTSFVIHGGGNKGAVLPENYEDFMAQYYGVPRKNIVELYGMTERNSTPLVCEYARKHVSPWEIPLLLDREGQQLLNVEFGNGGVATGRYGFIDLLSRTYWGGFITGDCVEMSFDRCPCGREGPQILQVTRYTDLADAPDEDKLSCAAEMTSYVLATLSEH